MDNGLTSTSTPTPTDTPSPTNTPESTSTPTDTPLPCFALISPEDGASLPELGRISFTWEAQVGAIGYRLEITTPDGNPMTYDTENTGFDLYLDTLHWGGEYNWQVTALDAQGDEVCLAGPLAFTKPQLQPTGPVQAGDTMTICSQVDDKLKQIANFHEKRYSIKENI
jgi:hypothetical protein